MTKKEMAFWAESLRHHRQSTDEDACDRFVELIELGRGGGLPEAKVLVSTLTDQPEDVGQGEAVLSLLCSFPAEVQARAIVEELTRFEEEGQHAWADSVTESLINDCRPALVAQARYAPIETRKILRTVLNRISESARRRGAPDKGSVMLKELNYE